MNGTGRQYRASTALPLLPVPIPMPKSESSERRNLEGGYRTRRNQKWVLLFYDAGTDNVKQGKELLTGRTALKEALSPTFDWLEVDPDRYVVFRAHDDEGVGATRRATPIRHTPPGSPISPAKTHHLEGQDE